jgi:hypothetical protein
MTDSNVQIVVNEAGDTTAVLVPIALWHEISSELETAHLLRSESMRKRLLVAMQRTDGVPLETAVEKLGL